MSSVFVEPGFWVGTLIAVAFTLTLGIASRTPAWRTTLGALGAVVFVAGLQWAWGSGLEAFYAAGLASFGMAVWGETAFGFVESRVRPEAASALVPIPVVAEPARSPGPPRPRRTAAAARPAATRRTPAARPTSPAVAANMPSPRAKPVTQAKTETRTNRVARAAPQPPMIGETVGPPSRARGRGVGGGSVGDRPSGTSRHRRPDSGHEG